MPPWVRLVAALLTLVLAHEEAHGKGEAAHGHEAPEEEAHSKGEAAHGHEAPEDDNGEAEAFASHRGAEASASHGNLKASHGGGAHGGGHAKKGPDKTNLAVSAMLLGTVIFNMSLFYLVNHSDPDIKHNSWAVISSTIAIFVAVLLFNGMQGIIDGAIDVWVKPLVSNNVEEQVLIWLRYMQFILWYVVMYATLTKQAEGQAEDRAASPENFDTKQKMTCWATLFAHMSGFAAISGGSALQSHGIFSEVPLFSFVPVLFTATMEFVMFQIRARVIQKSKDLTPAVKEIVAEYGDEAETDLGGLSLSFLTVQGLTFMITGKLPSHGGHHGPPKLEPMMHTVVICGLALVFVVLASVTVYISSKVVPKIPKLAKRWFLILETVVAMCFAWCILRAFQWEVQRLLQEGIGENAGGFILNPHTTIQRVLLALSVSMTSIAMIFLLDFLHDLEVTEDMADTAIKKVIMAIGILIGFSWEEAFNAGCDAFAALAGSYWGVKVLKLVLGLTVAFVVVPAWRLHILKNVLLLERKEGNHSPPEAESPHPEGYSFVKSNDKASTPWAMTRQS